MPNENEDVFLTFLLVIVVGFFALLIIGGLVMFLSDFSRELKTINMEIHRTTGGERRYWKRQRRRLWLSLIPFVPYRQDD